MFYSPLVELIERLLKKASDYGSRVYWGWTLLNGLTGGVFFIVLGNDGWDTAKPLLAIWMIVAIGGIYPVHQYEKHWKSKKD